MKKRTRAVLLLFIIIIVITCLVFIVRTFFFFVPDQKNEFQANKEGRVAIILEGVGDRMDVVRGFLELPYPITFGVLPRKTYSHELSQEIWAAGKETILNMPMEDADRDLTRQYIIKLMTDMSSSEIYENMENALDEVVFAAGVSNCIGSAFTRNRKSMDNLMPYLSREELFFIESKPGNKKAAVAAAASARKKRVAYAACDVYLDDKPGADYVAQQLNKLKQTALKKGWGIGIGRIDHPDTIDVLKNILPEYEEDNFKLVFASEIVQ
ncbi:MAG: divergent polysaccharide deacetylase family protein [Candidatus Margulisiibacteriota bacterium]